MVTGLFAFSGMTLFQTNPHGAQTFAALLEENLGLAAHNQLFELADRHTGAALVLTGEEVDSLTRQWLRHRLPAEIFQQITPVLDARLTPGS